MGIQGIGNWKLRIRREDDHVVILSALTCDARAVLPMELFGLPVTELGCRAFSPAQTCFEGEEVELSAGAAFSDEWDNRRLEELILPDTLKIVGDYAFYGCRSLRTLHLSNQTMSWGGGVFTGCDTLGRFLIDSSGNAGILLHYLTHELTRELDISLVNKGEESVRLIFPEYLEMYEENCPAHLFDCKIYGAGLSYHHVFSGAVPDLAAYDVLWNGFLNRDHSQSCAIRLAWYRLSLPEGLTGQAKADYLAYIRAHIVETGRWLISQRDSLGLKRLLEWTKPDSAGLSEMCETARQTGSTEAQALLLEKQHSLPPVGLHRSFEL